MNESVIIAQNINFNYGKTHILKNLSLSINAGEIYGIIGPSGSGKTTLIKAILGLIKLNSGELSVFGQKITFSVKQMVFFGQKITFSAKQSRFSVKKYDIMVAQVVITTVESKNS